MLITKILFYVVDIHDFKIKILTKMNKKIRSEVEKL
jgi:hypothetical protein